MDLDKEKEKFLEECYYLDEKIVSLINGGYSRHAVLAVLARIAKDVILQMPNPDIGLKQHIDSLNKIMKSE